MGQQKNKWEKSGFWRWTSKTIRLWTLALNSSQNYTSFLLLWSDSFDINSCASLKLFYLLKAIFEAACAQTYIHLTLSANPTTGVLKKKKVLQFQCKVYKNIAMASILKACYISASIKNLLLLCSHLEYLDMDYEFIPHGSKAADTLLNNPIIAFAFKR